MSNITLTLPELPPSLHKLYIRGRIKTKQYRAWEDICLYTLQRPQTPIQNKVRVCYTYTRPDKRRRDVFNLEKATSDILVKAGVIADDHLIVDGRLRWATEPMVEPVLIEMWEIEE